MNLNWLLTGVAAEDGTTYEDEFEKRLIEVFRNLDDYDKNEIIEFIRVKIFTGLSPTPVCSNGC
ncbi:hypothetical protein [Paenibacillus uliginis]|uniref:hypothetical protein n=1 Tax=Paenibacillus uliginis TaxID=683737 RepID=UPI001AECC6BF|nr:hypothetical protein [Paenibacillus uliginis]